MVHDTQENRINILEQQIHDLKNRLDDLTDRLYTVEIASGQVISATLSPKQSSKEEHLSPLPDIDSDLLWTWVGKSALLPRIAAICFIMVFGLILRTLTDNNVIGLQLGSYLGMCYAALLIGWGVHLLAKQSRLATVFPVCGVLLMYSIALETHVRFASISSLSVYLILFVLLITTSLVAIRFKHISLNILSIFGTCLVASFIDFPRPYFTPLIYLLLTGNILAFFSAKKLDKGEWNRFSVFLLTVSIWLLWTFRLRVPLTKGMTSAFYLSQEWFFPTIVLFSILYMGMSASAALKKKSTVFDLFLPTLNVLCAYPMALVVVKAAESSLFTLSSVGILFSAIHFIFAAYLFKQRRSEVNAIISFTLAGLLLVILTSPSITGNPLPALLLWSVTASIIAKISQTTRIGGLRFISYLLHGAACFAGLAYGEFLTSSTQPFFAMITAGVIAGLSGSQFLWCRKELFVTENGFFGRVDRADRSAILLLITCLVCSYTVLHLASFVILSAFSADPLNTLKGVQSILLNIGAILLLFLAMLNRNKEILTTAVIVIIIGAFKVFTYDLFKSNGIPLVLSVLSFGGVAATGSVILSRWSRNE